MSAAVSPSPEPILGFLYTCRLAPDGTFTFDSPDAETEHLYEFSPAEMGRMLVGMRSRGCDPRSPRHWPALARSLGALFIRSYERGERVHLAMLSRGYTGVLPDLAQSAHTHQQGGH